jgi:hypothetical protein
MSGNLNILPHKSWNVYNKKNRDQVAKDEAEYADELRRETERLALVNAEKRRTTLLARRKVSAAASTNAPGDASLPPVDVRVTLTDAFKEPAALSAGASNRSQLLDRPNYLSDVNSGPTPFYLQSSAHDLPDEATLIARADAASRQAQSLRTPAHIAANVIQESQAQIARLHRLQAERELADPMAALLPAKRTIQPTDEKRKDGDRDRNDNDNDSDSDSERHKKRRRHKSKHKHKGRDKDSKSLDQLRSERLAREQESRRRVQSLIVSERLPASVVNATATRR